MDTAGVYMPNPEFDFYAHALVNFQGLQIDTAEYLMQIHNLEFANFKLGQDVQIKIDEAELMQQAFMNCQNSYDALSKADQIKILKLTKKVKRNRCIAFVASCVVVSLGGIVYIQNR